MEKHSLATWFLGLATVLYCGCSSGNGTDIPEPAPEPVPEQIAITLHCGISDAATKATDTDFEAGDRIGLYVVNYNGETAGNLQATGNHVDNMAFTYNNRTWTPQTPVYWKDETTPADFYAYYPYASTPTDITAFPVAVKTDQSNETAYKASDFLWGKTSKVHPTEEAVNISLSHLFSCAVVKVVAGSGFTDNGLAASDVQVRLNNVRNQASVNLGDGTVTLTGNAGSVSFFRTEGNTFKALIVPQAVASDENFITVTIDGEEFNMEKEFTFIGGHRHSFTLTVRKTSNGINVDINDWIDDEEDNGGIAE